MEMRCTHLEQNTASPTSSSTSGQDQKTNNDGHSEKKEDGEDVHVDVEVVEKDTYHQRPLSGAFDLNPVSTTQCG